MASVRASWLALTVAALLVGGGGCGGGGGKGAGGTGTGGSPTGSSSGTSGGGTGGTGGSMGSSSGNTSSGSTSSGSTSSGTTSSGSTSSGNTSSGSTSSGNTSSGSTSSGTTSSGTTSSSSSSSSSSGVSGGNCTGSGTTCSTSGNVLTCVNNIWEQTASCPFGCNAGACVTNVTCTAGTYQCSNNTVEICNSSGTAWLYDATCAVSCSNGLCTGACTPGATRCNGNAIETCNSGGTAWAMTSNCANGCDPASVTCALTSLDITANTNMDGVVVVNGPVTVESGATLNSPTGNLTIRATSITVNSGGSITAAPTGNTPGGTGTPSSGADGHYSCGGVGGSYGTQGSAADYPPAHCDSLVQPAAVQGSSTDATVTPGSAGGAGNVYPGSGGTAGSAGPGGGRIQLIAGTINIAGQVTANGANGGTGTGDAGGGGGGSGGGILVAADSLTVTGTISASGGLGGTPGATTASQGGAGGLGRVKLLYGSLNAVSGTITGAKTLGILPPLTITSSTHPNPALIYNDAFTTLAFTWNRPFPSVQGYYYTVNQTEYAPATAATGLFLASELVAIDRKQVSAGANWFHLVSIDQQSNIGLVEDQFGIQVNTTPPTITSSSHADQTAWSSNNTVFYAWTLPTADANNKGVYYVSDHYGTTVPTSSATFLPVTQKQIILSNLANGIWGFHVVALDQAGYLTTLGGHYRVLIGTTPLVGGLLGNVTDNTSKPVTGATVTINHGLLSIPPAIIADQTTSMQGAYNFNANVPVGTWEITVTASGYQTQTQMATITSTQSTTLNFTLMP